MRAQIDFSRTPAFRTFLDGLFNLEIKDLGRFVQGIVVDLHPVWLGLRDFALRTGITPDIHDYYGPVPYPLWITSVVSAGVNMSGTADTDWTCESWKYLVGACKKTESGPFITKICTHAMRPGAPERRTLQAYADRQPFFCVLEERGPARVLANVQGGTEITTSLAHGTLGGFLQDQNSNIYGLTCAHVAMASTATYNLHDVGGTDLSAAATIAHTSFSNLQMLNSGQLCNRAVTTGQVPDVALLNINAGHMGQPSVRAIGVVDEILTENDLGSGSSVVLRGGVSGYHSAYVGGYSVVYNVLFEDGNEYCFDHMFEIITHSTSRFSALIPPVLTSKPVSGDSGAWVCAPSRQKSGNFAFAGMLTAGDGTNAYICFADAIQRWAAAGPKLNLSPL
jgi:hypothetical protein